MKCFFGLICVNFFSVKKEMGAIWNCTVLTNKGIPYIKPVVTYGSDIYTAAYCFINIHVRQTKPPQTILVNNMALTAVRTDLSEEDVDFTTEYQYADGDVVDVACVNFLRTGMLTMVYTKADELSDKFNSSSLSSSVEIGFVAKLHSGHNNSYMICTNKEPTDYTNVMVRFVMRTEFNFISININGMTLRPILNFKDSFLYGIDFKYQRHKPINVTCAVERADMKLVVMDPGAVNIRAIGYKVTETNPSKMSQVTFNLNDQNMRLGCSADKTSGETVEAIKIFFSMGNFPIDPYPLNWQLIPGGTDGTVMQLYEYGDEESLQVTFYEFDDHETLQFKCGLLHFIQAAPVLYLELKASSVYSDPCHKIPCTVSKTLHLSDEHDNTEIMCYLKTQLDAERISKYDPVLKEIRVILRKRILTTATTTTTTTTATTTTMTATTTTAVHSGGEQSAFNSKLIYAISGVALAALLMVIVTGLTKKYCCKQSEPTPLKITIDPDSVFYLNLEIFRRQYERELQAQEEPVYEEIE